MDSLDGENDEFGEREQVLLRVDRTWLKLDCAPNGEQT